MNKNFKKRESGFTLIELLVVIVVIGIFASISRPAVQSSLKNQRIKSSQRLLMSVIRRAKRTAVMQRTNTYLVIELGAANNYDEAPQKIYIEYDCIDSGERKLLDGSQISLPPLVKIAVTRSAGNYTSGKVSLTFKSTGTQDNHYYICVTYHPYTFSDSSKKDEFFTIWIGDNRGQLPRIFKMFYLPA